MNRAEFQHHFAGPIRVMFNWKLFASSDWSIELLYFAIPEQSARVYTPWYALTDGSVCDYNSANAKPQSVAAVASNPALRACHNIRDTPHPESTTVVPAYRVSKEAILLLDGNHRIVSGHVTGSPMALAAFVVCGPIDQNVLPDLVHWAQQTAAADRAEERRSG